MTRHNPRELLTGILIAALVSVACLATARLTGLTPNILWAPTDLPKALLLLGALAPWPVLALWLRRRALRG